MTDNVTQDRISAIGRVAILTSASEESSDPYVEVTTADARALLDERRDLAEKLTAATSTVAAVAAASDRWSDAFEKLHARIHRDFNFDAGECAPPEGETALRMMDDLVTFAGECHPEIEPGTVPAGIDKTGDRP